MVSGPEFSVSLTWEQLAVIFSSLTSVGTFVWTIVYSIARNKVQMEILWKAKQQSEKLDKTTTDQKTTWSFLMRRAQSEAVEKRYATIAPTLVIDKASYDIFPAELRLKMVKALGAHIDMADGAFMLEIERQFGDEMLQQVCIPNNLHAGACLYIAADMIRNTVPVPLPEVVH